MNVNKLSFPLLVVGMQTEAAGGPSGSCTSPCSLAALVRNTFFISHTLISALTVTDQITVNAAVQMYCALRFSEQTCIQHAFISKLKACCNLQDVCLCNIRTLTMCLIVHL